MARRHEFKMSEACGAKAGAGTVVKGPVGVAQYIRGGNGVTASNLRCRWTFLGCATDWPGLTIPTALYGRNPWNRWHGTHERPLRC